MKWWEEAFPKEERDIYYKANWGEPKPLGFRPVLLVVDVLYSFTGSSPKPIMEAIDEYPTSCGEYAWESLSYIKQAIDMARKQNIPRIFVRPEEKGQSMFGETTKRTQRRKVYVPKSLQIHEMVAPNEDEYVMMKTKASAFFDTPLATYLHRMGADSVIVTGSTTSGCVRATVVDGHSHGFTMFVLEDACFDRSPYSHRNSLFELNAKYATVFTTDEFCRHYESQH